jgi:RNA polymerase sigma-70 factor (ECF subfamily)
VSTAPSADPGFRAIFDAHHRELHAYCLRRLSAPDANEAAADAFFAVWRRLGEAPSETTREWLFAGAREAVDLRTWRSAQVRVVAHRDVAVPSSVGAGTVQVVRHPAYERVHDAMAGLRAIDRAVVLLELWEGLTPGEIAQVLGISERSVGHRRRRTLTKLASRDGTSTGATDPTAVAERIAAADPVPVLEVPPFGAASVGDLLGMVDARHAPAGPLAPLQLDDPSGGRRGLLLAGLVASAAVIVVLVLVLGVVGPPQRRTLPATTPPPTVAVTTNDLSEPPVDPLALPADTPTLDVVEAMYERWSRADIDGYRALIDDTAIGYNLASFDHGAWYRALSGVVDVRTCRSDDPGHVLCTASYFSGLAHGRLLFEEETGFIVENGRIVEIEPAEQLGLFNAGLDREGLVDYRNWVFERERDSFDELFAFGTSILLHTPELRNVHAGLMARYRAETSLSGPLRDARPIKVVDTYYGHLRAADVESALALVASTLPSVVDLVPTEAETWYSDVTGVALGRICDTLSPIQVRCEETYYSGLRPGTELTGRTLLYTVLEGRIVAIEAVGPVEDHVTADEPALARYRAWLAATDPTAAGDLFTAGGTLVLDTEAARAAHQEQIARFLEATSAD